MSSLQLLRSRRFGPLFATQFLGAFNDNLFKNALIVTVGFGAGRLGARDPEQAATWVNLAAAAFIAPFVLLSASAGELADRLDKSRLLSAAKAAEVAIMLLGAAGLWLGQLWLLLLALSLMGAQSAVFGPAKYAILPQHLRPEELVMGNGLLSMGTFAAILVGTLAGTWLPWQAVSGLVLVVALLGWASSRRIAPAPSAHSESAKPALAPLAASGRVLRIARKQRAVWLSILGISWFWLVGSVLLAQLPSLCLEVLGAGSEVVGVMLCAFTLGVGVGSLLCARLSGGQVELGLTPLGCAGLSLAGLDLFATLQGLVPGAVMLSVAEVLHSGPGLRMLLDLALLGAFGGLFVVPLYALIQSRCAPEERARVVSANNIVNALFMVVAAAAAVALRALGLGAVELLVVVAITNILVGVYIFTLVPEFLMRLLIWMLVHVFYRLRPDGLERLPEQGPAVIVCNHVSFVDAPILAALSRRPIRFVMDHRIYRLPVLHFIFKTGRAIPIASRREDPAQMERAFDEVAAALEDGDLVCIFPEGKLTGDGRLSDFRPGIERIIERNAVPVIPVALSGLWGSFFSRAGGRNTSRCLRSKVDVRCGEALAPQGVRADRLRERVLSLRGAVQ
ncbi:MAG: MFS transporter [Myxococcales bacterium]|nr:MFS transporter [Myxococcales bacterium]